MIFVLPWYDWSHSSIWEFSIRNVFCYIIVVQQHDCSSERQNLVASALRRIMWIQYSSHAACLYILYNRTEFFSHLNSLQSDSAKFNISFAKQEVNTTGFEKLQFFPGGLPWLRFLPGDNLVTHLVPCLVSHFYTAWLIAKTDLWSESW